jgi:hypothetical protein
MTSEQKLALRSELSKHPGWRWDEAREKPQCLCGEYLSEPLNMPRSETVMTVHLVEVIERFLAKAKTKE